MNWIDYDEFLSEQLQDVNFAAGYLEACLDEGEDVFLLGIRNVAMAQGGMKALADATHLNRESLYDMLSEKGNPLFSSVTSVLDKLGIELGFKAKPVGKKAA